jgi:hypothetical protein
MVRRGRGTKRPLPAPTDYHCSHGTTIIRGTSTRPLISYQANQPAVILADVAEPISEAEPPQKESDVNEDEKSESDRKSEMEDDRLYCVCRTLYDGRTMIACDRYARYCSLVDVHIRFSESPEYPQYLICLSQVI